MKQLFLASTFFELVCLAAGIDSGVYDSTAAPALLGTDGVEPADSLTADRNGPPRQGDRERILLLSNNAAVLELARPITSTPGAESLLARFDRVVDLNAAISPAHPSQWRPGHNDLPMVEAHLRACWDLGKDDIELVLESPQVNPAIALGRVFSSATIRVHADGLMSYGPTRNQIPLSSGQRMSTLHYLPLVSGLQPRLLAEFGIVPEPMSIDAFRTVVTEIGDATAEELDSIFREDWTGGEWALAVGQYLAALNLITEEEETALHVEMITQAADRGFTRLVFKPHPAAPPAQLDQLFDVADRFDVALTVLEVPALAEVIVDRFRPGLIIGGFSTALATARAVFGVPALAVGTDMLLESITPYQNSNRIPLTIISELCDGSDPAAESEPPELNTLVDAVAYCMAPEFSRDIRADTQAYLERHVGGDGDEDRSEESQVSRYFKRRRLTSLRLPGGTVSPIAPRRVIRRAGALALRAVKRQQGRVIERTASWRTN